jgi:hypothetical protein
VWSALGGALLALALIPAGSSAATIDFEARTSGEIVNNQYNPQGVTFNGPQAEQYPAGFAHSGTKGIEVCFAAEFCSAPVQVDFTTGQTQVGLWVGVNYAAPDPQDVRLTAFDSGGNPIGTANATVPAGPSPIATHLSVTVGSPQIFSLRFGRTADGNASGLAVDDVEFSAAGPPPPCGASGPPTVTLTSPPDQTFVQNNSILLRGNVNPHGAPITAATVVSEGSTTRTGIGFPSPIGAAGGNYAINYNGLLQLGNQKVHVTATNCAGTGISTNPIVTYSPLPPTASFTQLAPIEVVQTVQSPFNPVPLIAGGPNGTKRTIARVELGAEGVTGPITGVSGRLTATRPDGTRPGGPLTIDSLNTVSVGANQTLDGARATLNGTLNFELPPEWVTEGRLHLQLEQLRIEGAQSSLNCKNCDNWGGISATVSFHRVPPLRIFLVGIPFTPATGNGPVNPRPKDFAFLASWLRRAYPTAEVQVTQSALPVSFDQPGYEDDEDTPVDEHRDGFLCDAVNSRLDDFAATMPSLPSQTRFYGVVADTGGLFMRGCSNIGGRTGSGPAGGGNFGWDFDGSYTDWYGGHEIGHLLGRLHPNGGCDDSDDDDHFPFAGGLIGNSTFDNQGFDVGDLSLTNPVGMALYDWKSSHDVMTYCDNQWLSSYTYNGILRNLCGNDKPNCPDNATLSKRGRAGKRSGPRLAIHGQLNLANDHVALDPMSALTGLTLTEQPKKSPYAIVLRGAGGRRLKSYPFEPKEISDLPNGERLATIDEVVPFSKRTERIEVVRGGRRLISKPVSAHAPKVKLRSPKDTTLDAPLKLRWSAHDADGGKLLSTLQYAADAKHYVTIAAGLRKRAYQVDPATLPGGDAARFRVVVTDGVLTGIAKSKPVVVAAKPPRISIATPLDGAQLTDGQSVQLIASVADDQDVRLGDAVVWSSDRQGELGRGAMLTTKLQPGTHQLTASVTNSLGLTSTSTVHVDVAAIPPTVNAQLIP